MKIINHLNEIKELEKDVKIDVTIGNFDGVHLGHREFLDHIKQSAKDDGARFVVITFVPHPLQILKAHSGFLINTYRERRELLAECGVDYLFEIDFTRDFSTLGPNEFLERYIFNFKNLNKLYLGYDFTFGANKSGDFNLARELARKYNVELVLQQEYKVETSPVSSTQVRSAITSGEMENATELLGRKYFISGRVIKGEGRGKLIGFPTANLGYEKDLIIPGNGVYITQVKVKNMLYNAVTNIGINPTFNTGYGVHVESHLLDFSHDIYGEEIRVSFIKKIRDERKFPSVNDLVAQIAQDVLSAKEYFSHE